MHLAFGKADDPAFDQVVDLGEAGLPLFCG
jgi:hypothetical protein